MDGGQNGAVGFESRIKIFEDGLLIEDISNNPMGSVILQGTFQSGRTYQLISGVAVYGDTDFFPDSTGNGSGNFSTSLTLVPIPASAWLFGTGLIGLLGLSKRKVRI